MSWVDLPQSRVESGSRGFVAGNIPHRNKSSPKPSPKQNRTECCKDVRREEWGDLHSSSDCIHLGLNKRVLEMN